MAVSNNIVSLVNLLALLCSIPIIASGIWLASKPDNECIRWLRWPSVFIGVAILLVCLIGFMGAYKNKYSLLALYLSLMAILIVLSLVLLVLAFIVTRSDGAVDVPGRAYKEYRLNGFSSWLRDHITDPDDWGNIRACLTQSNFCAKLNRGNFLTAEHFFAARISPLQSGCCKPPTICGYQYVSPTMWVNPVNMYVDPDCMLWNNNPSQLCYNCDSCKAGLLGNLRHEWRKANVVFIVAVVLLICVYLIACSASKNAQIKSLSRK